MSYPMREPCPRCGSTEGYLIVKRGQNVVRCMSCQRFVYCAPKREVDANAYADWLDEQAGAP